MLNKKQLAFDLALPGAQTFQFFVPHSGVAESLHLVQLALGSDGDDVQIFVLTGPRGTGKTHLAHAALAEWSGPGAHITVPARDDESAIRKFIGTYEEMRAKSGLLLVEVPDGESVTNPHLASRLKAGVLCELAYPKEEELRPLVESLLERHSLRLPEESLRFLLERLPRSPLSLARIIAAIGEEASGPRGRAHRRLLSNVLHAKDRES